MNYLDAHCHLGWFEDPKATARAAAERGIKMLAVTVTAQEFLGLRGSLADMGNVMLAAGLHPWWVRSERDAGELCALLGDVRWVGEIGLDASPRHADTWGAQLAAFRRICAICAQASDPLSPKVLSIHAVRSASAVLDLLEETGAAERCRCVLHWFSGSSDELVRARGLGCWLSLGERALATRRGREYARQVPADRLLTETDLPAAAGAQGGAKEILASLERAVSGIAAARGISIEGARALLRDNALALLAD